MEKNQATGLVLIFGILFVYFTFFAPDPQELPKAQKPKTELKAPVPSNSPTQEAVAALQKLGIADSNLVIDTIPVWMENDDLRIKINPVGAQIASVELKKYKTWQGKPLELISERRTSQKLTFMAGGKLLNISSIPFKADQHDVKIVKDSATVAFSYQLPEGGKIEQRFALKQKGFTLGYRLLTEGLQIAPKTDGIFDWNVNTNQLEKDIAQNRTTTSINFYTKEGGFNNLSETSLSEEKKELSGPIQWITFKQKFFNAGIIAAGSAFTKAGVEQKTDEADTSSVKNLKASIAVPFEGNALTWTYFFGPNQFKLLKSVAEDYDKNVYLGWPVINLVNRFITVNVFDWLQGAISSYGIIIIILVLLIKLLLFPLSYKSYISMAKMKVLKPELDEIKERTGDDMQKAQAEQMKLYQQVGINPLSGCIPLLLQMPILLAMFNFFPNAIELRQQSFLWAPDLSTYDSIATLPFSLPGYGNHVSLFTILMTASTLVLTFYNNQTTTVAGPMQSMSYIMPVVFMFILNSLPAGLSFYYLVSNVVSIVQQQVIKRFVDEGDLRRKLEDNKVKNAGKKKTGFAARLEEAMRLAQENQKEKERQKKSNGNPKK